MSGLFFIADNPTIFEINPESHAPIVIIIQLLLKPHGITQSSANTWN
jgi:hypothetical protein